YLERSHTPSIPSFVNTFVAVLRAQRSIWMRYDVHTYMTPQEVIEAATSFFGVDQELELQSQGFGSLHFVGGGGHVTLTVKDEDPVTVELETREWDAQVEEFMARVARKRWWRRLWKGIKEEFA
ncbi:MAG: hypothetical protein M3361_22400, partial [Candidatus Tectomicrobia bacterium]|nr:hypothetical protein [Candidatus Tectomicrobia bacterium]